MKSTSSYRLYRRFALVGLSCVLSFGANLANAFPFTLTIDNPDRIGHLGSTEIFSGKIANDSGGDVLASDLFLDFSGFDPLVVSLSQLLGSPDFTIADGTTSGIVDLFSFDLAPTAVPGPPYLADVFVQDGSNPFNMSNIATISVGLVPEPATLGLVGIALIAIVYRKGHARPRTV
jgi:PEP-CTERM motif